MNSIFGKTVPGIGELGLEPLQVAQHAAIVHTWLTHDHARFWGMQWMARADVERFYTDMAASSEADAWLGRHDGEPMFLVECYDPAADPIGRHYDVRTGDRGMHILLAPSNRRISGFSRAVFDLVMDFLFSDAAVERVVVEPDIENDRIHELNQRAGFVYERRVKLPEKTAALAFCTRAQYRAAQRTPVPVESENHS